MRGRLFSLLAVGILTVLFDYSQILAKEDLLSLYRSAQLYDATFAAAKAAHEADSTAKAQGRSYLLPQAKITSSFSHTDTDSPYYGDYNSKIYGISLVQSIFDLSRFFAYKQSLTSVAIGDAKFEAAKKELMQRVAKAYFDVLIAQEKLFLAIAELTTVEGELSQVQRLYAHGEGTITDIHNLEARKSLVEADIVSARNELAQKKSDLSYITGIPVEEILPLRENIPLEIPQPNDLKEWIGLAKEKSPYIILQTKTSEYHKQEWNKQRAQFLPTANLVLSKTVSERDLITYERASEIRVDTASLQLQLPIFEGGYTMAKTKESFFRYQQALEQLRATESEIAHRITNAYMNIVNGVSKIQALRHAVKAQEISIESTKKGYEAGIRTIADILNAQRDYYSVKRNLAEARCLYVINIIDLKAYSGLLSDGDIAFINSWLEDK
ncbi:MAG: TolC family outer membrane protein [Syntrophobacterales bacterium]|nr:TolC family outer membrane protein [Syntrophobacterales bacterium]